MILLEDEDPRDIIRKLSHERQSLSNLYTWQLHNDGKDVDKFNKWANRYYKIWSIENSYRYDIRMRPSAFLPEWVEQYMDTVQNVH